MNPFCILALAPLLAACSTLSLPNAGPGTTVTWSETTPSALIYDVSWDDLPGGTQAHAALVIPAKAGPGPGIVYFHQLGQSRNWTEFLAEAKQAAERGVRSLLMDGQTPWAELFEADASDQNKIDRQMDLVRRAVTVLKAQPGVDATRLAFVGHDYGAMYGALLSGEDTPVSRFVLIVPAARWSTWITYFQWDPDKLKAYPGLMAPWDPLTKVLARPNVPRLIQLSQADRFLNAQDQATWKTASTAEIQTMEGSSHDDVAKDGAAQRQAWLYSAWGLMPPGSDLVPTVRFQGPQGPLLVGKTEVTQAQWKAVAGDAPAWSPGPDKPVEMVSWEMAAEFCNKLSALEGLPAAYQKTKDIWKPVPKSTGWRLPTVAEWEAAARGTGAKSDIPGNASLPDLAWLWSNAAGETHAVATRTPNSLGLYDMAGNVREWCQDEGEDPTWHLIKGGGAQSDDKYALISTTEDLLSNYHKRDLGLRVVRSVN